jgi:3',5'-cyclic AMP phosphodiesterase CpdA
VGALPGGREVPADPERNDAMGRILLFHLSDLHFGSGFIGTTNQLVGLNGHDVDMCRRLRVDLRHARLNDFHANGEDAINYLIGGDLTRIGSDHDFHLSHTYTLLQLDWVTDRMRSQQSAALGLPHDHVYAIPGNHDHWRGIQPIVRKNVPLRRPPAYNPDVFPDFLEPTPWRHTLWSPDRTFAVELFGVDSNEGLRNKATNLRAEGELSQEELLGKFVGGALVKPGLSQLLQAADAEAANDRKPRVKAVACHHAFGNKGGLLDAWPLSNQSIQDLLTLARQYDVRAVLTGHTHYFLHWQQAGSPTVWELRCGSTTQKGKQPQPQGFWVHEIDNPVGSSRGLGWRAWKYQWDGTQFLQKPAPVNVH